MKVKHLFSILQGLYNAYPDLDVVFDVHDPETIAKASVMGPDLLSDLDAQEVHVYMDGDDGLLARIRLMSQETTGCINECCKEFDRTYKKISD